MRCRQLFATVMRGMDDLVYDPEGDRILLDGRVVTVASSSPEEEEEEGEGVE